MNKFYIHLIKAQKVLILFLVLSAMSINVVNAQAKRNKTYETYIDKYNSVAVDHMKKYKIPASITLAQGLLESGAGLSSLASEGNNHFGIKCHSDWKGATMRKDDDRRNECFRKYKKVEDSYHDHSLFLTERSRYSFLFNLQITDYRGWARGLQQAGYATDKAYANKLIKIIDDYELYKYDSGKKKGKDKPSNDKFQGDGWSVESMSPPPAMTSKHTPYKTHGLIYVIAVSGDTYESIADEFKFKAKDLYKYNEVPKGYPLAKGDLVYFQNKKNKADTPYYEHVVKVGESMHSIAQQYGVKIKNLYRMNKRDYEYVPTEGDILKLR